jgi:hypothetical protein
MLSHVPLASIIITSYNYAAYLAQAIDSALAQTYPHVEVIVVDDGSADNSREIIASYGNRVISVLKENGGQASAINAGFKSSAGHVICFLDSDDVLMPTALGGAVQLFHEDDVVKVHWPLWTVDEHSVKSGAILPPDQLSDGNLREQIISDGPGGSTWPPTSGNAWARRFLEQILPMPEQEFKLFADAYLLALAPASGTIRRIDEPQGLYRLHGQNNFWGKPFDEMLRLGCTAYEKQCTALSQFMSNCDLHGDVEQWMSKSWWHQIEHSLRSIARLIPAADALILVDDDQWGADAFIAGRRRYPFLEHDGQYWGPPSDDARGIQELERLRKLGAGWIVFAWPSFWWLEQYVELKRYLSSEYYSAHTDERLIIFDLRA